MTATDIIVNTKASYIVATKKVVLLHSKDKKHFEEGLSEDELELLFLIECKHCEPGKVWVITDRSIARGFVVNELLKQRESEASGKE